MSQDIAAAFEREMWRLYEEPKRRFGYNATYFLRMLEEGQPVDTARTLVLDPRHSDGLTYLWEKRALDLSVEALVLRDPWCSLFTPDVLDAARKKLRGLGYSEAGLGL
jgi:hypothetical protein